MTSKMTSNITSVIFLNRKKTQRTRKEDLTLTTSTDTEELKKKNKKKLTSTKSIADFNNNLAPSLIV